MTAALKPVKFVTLLSSVRPGRMSDRVLALTDRHVKSLGHTQTVIAVQRCHLDSYNIGRCSSASCKNMQNLVLGSARSRKHFQASCRRLSLKRCNQQKEHGSNSSENLSKAAWGGSVCEQKLNDQINMEYDAWYLYEALASYCDRSDVAFPNMHKFLKMKAKEELEHAESMKEYQNKRGGRVQFQDIKKPEVPEVLSVEKMISSAKEMEENVKESLEELHKMGEEHDFGELASYLDPFVAEQTDDIKLLSDFLTVARRDPNMFEQIYLAKYLADTSDN